jgi:hypothetical protein
MSNAELLRLARAGDQAELVCALELKTRATHATSTPGQPLTESEKLLDEALWYARLGDLDEAKYRLSMADEDDLGEDD